MKIVIQGKQGSGKTTIIEALKVCGFVVTDVVEEGGFVAATVELPENRGDFFSKLFSTVQRETK